MPRAIDKNRCSPRRRRFVLSLRPQIGRRIDVIDRVVGFVGKPVGDAVGHPIEDRQQIVVGGPRQLQHRQLSGVVVGDEHDIGYDQVIMNVQIQ